MMFRYPWLLLLLLIIIPLVAWYVRKWRNSNPSLGLSTTAAFGKYAASGRYDRDDPCADGGADSRKSDVL